MKTTVSSYQFVEAFRAAGRESQFSRPALFALFEYLEDYEDSCGVELELDPVGICCDWSEYPTALDAAKDFGYREGVDSKDESPLEWLQNRTDVIQFWENGVIVLKF